MNNLTEINMRKIKFRGKLTTSNVFMYAVSLRRYDWIYGGIHFAYDCAYIHSCEHFNKGFSVTPETVGQFTGLKDVNDEDIYEGDILTNGERNYTVEYRNGAFWVINHYGMAAYQLCKSEIKECCFTVVGNIHDNPKLIKTDTI